MSRYGKGRKGRRKRGTEKGEGREELCVMKVRRLRRKIIKKRKRESEYEKGRGGGR